MTNQGIATISRTIDSLIDEFKELGFDIDPQVLSRFIYESDVLDTPDEYRWIEAASQKLGDVQDHPHIVYCSSELNPDAVTRREYKPLPVASQGEGEKMKTMYWKNFCCGDRQQMTIADDQEIFSVESHLEDGRWVLSEGAYNTAVPRDRESFEAFLRRAQQLLDNINQSED